MKMKWVLWTVKYRKYLIPALIVIAAVVCYLVFLQ